MTASQTTVSPDANPNHHTWDAVNHICLICGCPMTEENMKADCPEQGGELENGDLDKAIKETITSIAARFDSELFALSESDLTAKWYFTWDERGDIAWNIYQFSDMLEMHKRRCRRWEEHHNGSMCVVERVRDKYLMPRVKEFAIELGKRQGQTL